MLQSNNKKPNPCFCEDAGDYLEANGFIRADQKIINDAIYFFKDGVGVVIYGDNADFMLQHEAEPGQRNSEYKRFAAYTGISALKIFEWMLLLHISGIIPIKSFLHNVMKEGVQFGPKDLLQDLFSYFQVTDNIDALPLGY